VTTIPWEQVREVVDAVLDLPAEQRSPYLDQACPQSSVRRYVESLVLSYEQAGEFLGEPAIADHATAFAEGGKEGDSWKGRRVGPYEVSEEIGEGGMGAVYRAKRVDDQYEKQVAIKVVRSGFDTRFALNRFKAERQILANLEHPNIARLLEGGTTEDGQPYFVMEYIQGQPLDQYCDERKLTVTERLELFRKVCGAVQYAHQNLVIHRDIKPGNILVTGEGVPKLLDFGIAKMLTPEAGTVAATQTMTMVRLMTPEYASPEQLLDEPITTASDIYSLGVVLYELLTGQRPYRFGTRKPEEIARVVTKTDPEKPSTAVGRAGNAKQDAPGVPKDKPAVPEVVGRVREGSREKLRRRLTGDLDNIVLMALRKEPQRRYASVEQFSEDIRRHLEGMPVVARTDTFAYRSSKFVKRHAAGVTAGVLVVVSLAVGLAFALREARIAKVQRARAEQRFNDVRALANSLMFNVYDSIKDLPGSTQARQLVVTNALKYLDSLAHESRGDLSLQRELADAYERVGSVQGEPYTASLADTPGSLQSYLKAQSIRKSASASLDIKDQIKYAANLRIVSGLQMQSSNAVAAVQSAQAAVSVTEPLLQDHPTDTDLLTELGADYEALGAVLDETRADSSDSQSTAGANYKKALEIDEKLAANSKGSLPLRNLAVDEFHIARHLRDAGYRTEALEAFNKAVPIFEKLAEDSNKTQAKRDLSTITMNMGDTFQMNGDPAKALASYRRALDEITEVSAADPKNGDARMAVGEANLNVGTALVKLKNPVAARVSLGIAIDILEKAAASNSQREEVNWDLAVTYVWMASVTADRTAALADYQKAISIAQRLSKLDPTNADWHENEAEILVKLGDFQRRQNELNDASSNYSKAAAIAEPIVASQPEAQEALYALTGAYCGLGDIAALRAQQSSNAASWKEAKSWYERCAGAWQHLRHPAAVSPNGFDCGSPEEATRGLARSNAALSRPQRGNPQAKE